MCYLNYNREITFETLGRESAMPLATKQLTVLKPRLNKQTRSRNSGDSKRVHETLVFVNRRGLTAN